ncbi:MAG: ATP phosphoribosyltransferase regulatory subunit [Candidatus Sericytochromatia bacterium]|nr:ATP phosphoribosyltransferase regulatory subunit [Candidatus Tanganyikabacteria bacterium]
MAPLLARVPPGVQTFFDDDVHRRRQTEAAILDVFGGWSYEEIWLPAFDYLDLFSSGMGAWLPERTYKFIDRDGHLLALRPDLTSLVARTVATRFGDRRRPVRLCYSGEVFRYDAPQHGRKHDLHQLGIELFGSADLRADLEVLLVGLEAMRAVGIDRPLVTLSHAGFHRALLEDRPAEEGETLLAAWRRRAPGTLPDLAGTAGLARARSLTDHPAALAAVSQLEEALALAGDLGLGDALQVDLGEVAAMAYYTGMTFRAYAPGYPAEIGSGGRYDALLGALGRPEPAVGMVLYREALLAAGRREAAASAAPALAVSGLREALAARSLGRRVRLADA